MDGAAHSLLEQSRFTIIRRIGAGGMGVVFEAHDTERDVRVALKLLPAADPVALVRFKNEFRSIASIVHPNLVPLYELISTGEQWFFTMELIDGVDLLSFLNRPASAPVGPDALDRAVTRLPDDFETTRPHKLSDEPTGPVPVASVAPAPVAPLAPLAPLAPVEVTPEAEQQLRALFGRLAPAVAFLHGEGVVHRDLKPANVMVRRNGEPVILDFGLAASLRDDESDSEVVGTVAYMAPEQVVGDVPTPAADWYAFGVMLYEALTGALPFRGTPSSIVNDKLHRPAPAPAALLASVPPDLNRLCVELLATDPADRPTGEEIVARILGAPESAAAHYDDAPPPELVLVGREPLLAQFDALLHRVGEGAAVVLHLHGHSGMGKSALLAQFLERAAGEQKAVVLAGRCFEQESMPFKALDSIVDSLARYLQDLPADAMLALLPPDIAALGLMFPALQNAEAIRAAPQDVLAIPERRELRQRAFAALRALLKRLGETRLLVLAIDDLQWGDTDSAAFLAGLLEQHDSPRLMLIVSYRTEQRDAPCIRALSERRVGDTSERHSIEVLPLEREAIGRLIGGVLPAAMARREEWIERIAVESGGSPYFALELAQTVGEGMRDGAIGGGAVTLDAVLWQRMQQLSLSSIHLLEAVALAGQPLRTAYAYQGGALSDRGQGPLAALRAERLVRTTGPGLADDVEVYHDRIRETVVTRMEPLRRSTVHAALARAMEAGDEVDPERIGRHYEAAGVADRAGHHYARAAGRAVDALAFERGAVLYRRALDLAPQDDERKTTLMVGLAQALSNAGRGPEAATVFRSAADRVTGGDSFDLRHHAAAQYCISGHIDEARSMFRGLMHDAGLRLPSTTAESVVSLALRRLWLRMRGLEMSSRHEPPSALDLRRLDLLWSCSTGLSAVELLGVAAMQTQCLLLALRVGDPHRVARSLAWEAVMTGIGGASAAPRVAALLERAEATATSIDLPQARAIVLLARGWTTFLQVRLRESIHWCEEAERVLRENCTGVWWEIGTMRTMTAWALVHSGDLARLSQVAPGFLRDAIDRGDLFTKTNVATVGMGHLHLAADDPERAQHEIDDAMSVWPRGGFDMQHLAELFGSVNVRLYMGDGEGAHAMMTAAWPRMRNALHLANQFSRVMMRELKARCALAAEQQGHRGLTHIAVRAAAQIAREDAPWAEPFACRVQAALAAAQGRRDETVGLLRRAADGFDAHDLRLHAAATRSRLGMIVEGDEGMLLREEAARFMRLQSIRRIDRMTDMYVPKMPALEHPPTA